jgi:hypothetical protein
MSAVLKAVCVLVGEAKGTLTFTQEVSWNDDVVDLARFWPILTYAVFTTMLHATLEDSNCCVTRDGSYPIDTDVV